MINNISNLTEKPSHSSEISNGSNVRLKSSISSMHVCILICRRKSTLFTKMSRKRPSNWARVSTRKVLQPRKMSGLSILTTCSLFVYTSFRRWITHTWCAIIKSLMILLLRMFWDMAEVYIFQHLKVLRNTGSRPSRSKRNHQTIYSKSISIWTTPNKGSLVSLNGKKLSLWSEDRPS